MGPLPVTSQTRAMWTLRYFYKQLVPDQLCLCRRRVAFMQPVWTLLAKLKALQPHLARRVAVTHFDELPMGNAQQSLGL